MSDYVEVAITSDSSDELWNCCVWDVRTGTHLLSYKGGGAPCHHTFSVINQQYFLAGRATAAAVSPDGNYCVVAVQEVIYVYLLLTGAMIATISSHYLSVTTLCFNDSGSHFVSAGQDGKVLVWSLSQVVRVFQRQISQAVYSFSDHALSVTDLYVGKGRMKALLCSVSLDRSCKIYDLTSGSMLLNITFQESLTSVTMNALESIVFVGTNEGPIYAFSITLPPRTKEYLVIKKQHQKNVFLGHKKQVTCISVSRDEELLLSGGADEQVIVWHIKSRQQLRVIPHKGIITTARFLLTPKAMFNQETKLNLSFQPFQKTVYPLEKIHDLTVDLIVQESTFSNLECRTTSFNNPAQSTSNLEEISKLKKEIQHLKMINKEIYEFCVKSIVR
ncbi:WD repeat-containing protein 18 isoform X2 [Sabethes cyaneus]|uniref:WD repeat-containing protein 18 isoform X2 n=1 Tax=Sabethes cyaneus TaxID=53552 RepID=UPI00237E1B7D|nr:WD repeat-containing protein 18 isoform X2 [Sabethes cyaneus]